jgi:hypothetical protein
MTQWRMSKAKLAVNAAALFPRLDFARKKA